MDLYENSVPREICNVYYLFDKPFKGLFVSIDGTYNQPGWNAHFGVSFVFDLFSGKLLDFSAIEKCFDCKNHLASCVFI